MPASASKTRPAQHPIQRVTWAAVVLLAMIIYATPHVLFERESLSRPAVPNAAGKDIALKLSIDVAEFSKETVTFKVESVAGALAEPSGNLAKDLVVKIGAGGKDLSQRLRPISLFCPGPSRSI